MGKQEPNKFEPIDIRLRGEESAGQLAVVEMSFSVGDTGPPLHVHPHHGEGFYVLSGEMTFRVGEDTIWGQAGAFAFAAAGVQHTLGNLSTQEARVLIMCAPAGFERYFERLAAGHAGPPETDAYSVGPPLSQRAADRSGH